MQETVLSRKLNVYGAITEKIARAIKEAKGSYQMPWHTGDVPLHVPTNAVTDHPYRGVNILSLWIDASRKGFPSAKWASYKQWQTLGAQVRRGQTGSLIIFYKALEQTELEKELGELPRNVAKATWVFNAAQVDNWLPPDSPPILSEFQIDEGVTAFIEAVGANIEHGYSMARYRPDMDRIEMPSPSWFIDTKTQTAREGYHSTLLHELTHWTGASHRLDRLQSGRPGKHAYAFEELIAELGAAFMCAAFKITNEPRLDHAAYVAGWLEVFNDDPRAIFTASHRAQQAIEYLGSLAVEKLGRIGAVPAKTGEEQVSAQ